MKEYNFIKAVPVWEAGKDKTINYNLVFRTIVPKSNNAFIALSASNMYQMFVNGTMVSEGPARAGHGYYRVDEVDISSYLTNEENVVAIYVNGYYVKNYYLIRQPAFLCAEVVVDNNVISATGFDGFEAKYHSDRVRKVTRYSAQRTFTEVYGYDSTYKDFELYPDSKFAFVKLVETEVKNFIERGVPYPSYNVVKADKILSKGMVEYLDNPIEPNRSAYIDSEDTERGFKLDDVEIIGSDEVDKCIFKMTDSNVDYSEKLIMNENSYAVYKFSAEKTGFVKLDVEVEEDAELILCFDEFADGLDVNFKRSVSCQNVVIWFLKPGKYSLVTNEPYSLGCAKLINKSFGKINISTLSVIEFAFDIKVPSLNSDNEKLDKIYNAAVETFKQNTVDIYMDCPSRERAGWLCDSYFTARVEKELTGKSLVEKNYLENFIITEGFTDIDSRMFAMCYPSDSRTGNFIPNWAMWYVLELEEYLERTSDRELVDSAKDRLYGLVEYFEEFENSDGLLEKLDKWVFVEWSMANNFVQDVNYPSNMLYAKMLRVMGKLYDKQFIQKAEKIEKVIKKQSYFDGFFHDHAIRNEDGSLCVLEEDITETCQYYAFYMGVATKEEYPELWNTLLNDFTADRVERGLWSEIHPANAFIGYYLRLDLLSKENEKDAVLKDIEDFFYSMAEKTGTLWEHNKPKASCNHGFASHVIVWLNKFLK